MKRPKAPPSTTVTTRITKEQFRQMCKIAAREKTTVAQLKKRWISEKLLAVFKTEQKTATVHKIKGE